MPGLRARDPRRLEPAGGARLSRRLVLAALVSLLSFAAVAYLAGVRRELPFAYEGDERTLVQIAVRMAVSQDLNPRWFGNPGSTVLYPLAFLYRAFDVVWNGAPLFGPDRALFERFRSDPGLFYLAGRTLNVGYAIGGLALLFLAGRRAFNERAALGGVLLATLCPMPMAYAQLVRTDAAALFFGALSLWACLRLLDAPTPRRHLAAGAAIGLAIASRYFLAALFLPYAAACLLRDPVGRKRHAVARSLLGLVAAAAAFFAATPFFLLDLETALQSLAGEARASHPGADGLSPFGNLLFYAGEVIPGQLGPALAVLAGLGIAAALVRRAAGPRVLALFVIGLLAGICLSPLHWPRWTIPALPLLALFAAATLEELLSTLLRRQARPQLLLPAFAAALLVLAWPTAARFGRAVLRAARPTTRLQARAWLLDRLPDAARVVAERGSAPLLLRQQALEERLDFEPRGLLERTRLGDRSVEVLLVASLAKRGPLDDYRREGYDYALTARYEGVAQSEHEVRVDRQLASEAKELARFDPQWTRAGPVVQVWQLR